MRESHFQLFHRSHTHEDGFGIGLVSAKALANVNGATVYYRSIDGGSEFGLRVPEQPSDDRQSSATREISFSPIRILIIDDDPLVRNRIVKMLQDFPASIREQDSLDNLEHVLDEETPDLILSDVHIKNENAISKLAEINKLSTLPPIIILTGSCEAVDHGRWCFISGILQKPVSRSEIHDMMRRTLSHIKPLRPPQQETNRGNARK